MARGGGERTPPRFAGVLIVLGVAAAWIIAGLLVGRAVQARLALGEDRVLVPGLLELTHIRNTGAAYGLLAGQRWLLVLTSAAILLALPLLLRALPRTGRWPWLASVLAGLIAGGAAGNLIERARYGYVTDYLTMPPIPLFRVFNLADVGISLAVAGLIALSLLGGPRPAAEPAPMPRQEGEGSTP